MKRLFFILMAVCIGFPVLPDITNCANASTLADRLTDLRGMAQIIIADNPESGDKWKDGLSRIGDSIDMNAIPDTIRQISKNADEKCKGLNDRFKTISAQTSPAESEIQSLQKDAEGFSGVIKQDTMIITGIQVKLDKTLAGGGLPASKMALITNYMKMVSDCKKTLTASQADIGKITAFKFKNQHK